MLQKVEHILETHPDIFTECQHACKAFYASYLAHYAAVTPSTITAMATAHPGYSLIIAGTRIGTIHAISLNSAKSTLSLPSFTEPGLLAPAPVSDLAPLGRSILAARGYVLTVCCMDSGRVQNMPVHAPISSISTVPIDHSTVLLGFINGTFGQLDLRSNSIQLHEINRFGSFSTRNHTIGSVSKIDNYSCDAKVCAKQYTGALKQIFISVEKPGTPARVWDVRSTSSMFNIGEPSMNGGRVLWGEYNRTHIAVLSSSDTIFLYNHKANYRLEYYSHVTTRHSARCAWIDDCRLISGTYSRMRETDQRGFPIIAIPETLENETEPLKNAPIELAYEWINCPFQMGTSALYPFSSKSLPILNTFYGIAMDDSICVLDERPGNPIIRTRGPVENHYESGFSHCSDKPLGMPKESDHQNVRDDASFDNYLSNISNTIDLALKRWGTPIYQWSPKSLSFSVGIYDDTTLQTNVATTPVLSSLSQSDRISTSQDRSVIHNQNDYGCYSYSSTCCISQFTQEKETASASPPLKLDQSTPRCFIPWKIQHDNEHTQGGCLEVDSLFDKEDTDYTSQGGLF